MTPKKQTKAYAKSLIKLCVENGEFSEERVSAVLQVLEKNPPRNYVQVLRAFLALVRREVANHTASVEHAGALSPNSIELIQSGLSKAYDRKIVAETRQNDELIAGVRVRVGCDVYESSVAGALRELQSSLS